VPLAKRFRPDAITLDIGLPDMDGYALLDLLKRNPKHVISRSMSSRPMSRPARAFHGSLWIFRQTGGARFNSGDARRGEILRRRPKRLLAIEPAVSKGSLSNLIGEEDVEIESVSSIPEGEDAISENGFDCVVLDLSAPAEQPLNDLVKALRDSDEPLVVFMRAIRAKKRRST